MAKEDTKAAEVATDAAPAATSRAISVKAPVTINHPVTPEAFEEALKGETRSLPRAEFIRELWKTRQYTRSQITALTRLAQGNPALKYQIIFQATKGQEGGEPPKQAAAPAEAAPAEG